MRDDEIEVAGVRMPPVAGADVVVHSLESRYSLDRYRGALVGEDGRAPTAVLENIRDMATKRIRNAQWAKLYSELMGWTGSRELIIAAIVRELGVPIDRAREAVGTVMDIPDDIHEVARINREFLDWYDGPAGPGREHSAMLTKKNGKSNGNGAHK